jgi:hypothetical protein
MFLEYVIGHATGRPGSRRRATALLLGGLAMVALASCVYDSNKRCGPNQILQMDNGGQCVCDDLSVGTADGCVPCGTNEVAGATGCQCAPGFGKSGPTDPCTLGGGVIDAGSSNSQADADSAAQQEVCTTDNDCTGGAACDLKVSPSICRTPPLGLGKACTSTSDCAGTEATFCDVMVTKACAVQGCSLAPDNCFPGYICCDLSKYGIPTTVCAVGNQCL